MVRLHALGPPFLEREDGSRLDGLVRQTKRFALLIFLHCDRDGVAHRREDLIATFWPEADDSRGRNALRQSLFAIRKQLKEEIFSCNGGEELRVDRTRFRSDAAAFHEAAEEGAFDVALALYSGPFLDGFHLPNCPEFGFWVERMRADLDATATAAAQNLAHAAEGDRDLDGALFWWHRAAEIRPFDERIARRLMALLAGDGNRGRAVAEFDRFRERMVRELEIEPSEKTLDLLKRINDGTFDPAQQWIGDRRRRPAGSAGPRDAPGIRFRRRSDGSPF